MKTYQVLIRDSEGYEIGGPHEVDGLKAAKERARYMAGEQYARNTESTHSEGDMVVVLDEAGENVFDLPVEV